jgi:hypothetical protein
MGYKEIYEKAKNEGQVKELTAQYKEWKQPNDIIVGKFISTNKVQSRLGGSEYNQYLFETDEGLIKFALGAITDHEALPLMKPGGIYAIEYQGKQQIQGGRQVNRFNVTEVDTSDVDLTAESDEDDVPF